MEPRIPDILSGVRGSGGLPHITDKAWSRARELVCSGVRGPTVILHSSKHIYIAKGVKLI